MVVALVPAHRRADRVGQTVEALRPLVDRVIVIDDGSDDGGATAGASRAAGAEVVVLATNRGKGGALTAGVAASPEATTYLLIDADLGATAAGAAPLLAAVEAGADLAVGVLPAAGTRGGFGAVKRVARAGIRAACGFDAEAPLSGQRAVRGELVRRVLPLADRFGVEVGMTIDAIATGAAVVEVPVEVDHRHTGRSLAGLRHRAGQGYDVLRALWPRLLTGRLRCVALIVLAVMAVVSLVVGASRSRPDGAGLESARRVVLVAAPPGLTMADARATDLPSFSALAGSGGVLGAAQVISARRDPRALWASVGAGMRVDVSADLDPQSPPDRPFLVTGAGEGAGALADSLHRAGMTTAFVGPSTSSPVRWAVAGGDGDIDRAATAASVGVPGMANRALADLQQADLVAVDAGALDRQGFDDLLSRLRPAADGGTLLVIVSPPARSGELTLTPIVVSGPGAPAGLLTSPSTRRAGLVLATDVAPTILRALGLSVPATMSGRPVERLPEQPNISGLERLDRLSRQRAAVWDPSILPLVLIQIALYGWTLWRRPAPGDRRRRVLFVSSLLVAGWPLGTWLTRGLPGIDRLGAGAAVVALTVDAVLVAAAWRLGGRRGLAPLAVLLGTTVGFVAVDLGAGGPLELSSAFGYAATSAGRFTGLGNGGFAIVATAVAVLVACAPRRAPWIPVLLGATTVLIGAPVLGNDIGGLLTVASVSVVTVAVLWDAVRWQAVVGALVVGVGLVLAAGAYDLSRPPNERSHIGRFLTGGRWLDVLERRSAVNLHGYLVIPVLVPLVLIALGMAVGLWRGRWTGLLPLGSTSRVGLGAALAIALIGHAVNDSGPVLVGIACITIGPFLVLRALAVDEELCGPAFATAAANPLLRPGPGG